jgi:hypothetical protein
VSIVGRVRKEEREKIGTEATEIRGKEVGGGGRERETAWSSEPRKGPTVTCASTAYIPTSNSPWKLSWMATFPSRTLIYTEGYMVPWITLYMQS